MAKVICGKHGLQFGMIVCEHVADAIETNRPLHYTPSLHPDLEGIWLCDQCASELETITLDPDLEAFLSRMKPPCALCARAWREAAT